jgi:hypothetical protein
VSHLVDEQGLRYYECEAADGAQYVLPHSDNATCTLTALAVRPVKVTVVKVPVPCTYVVFFDYKNSFKTFGAFRSSLFTSWVETQLDASYPRVPVTSLIKWASYVRRRA